jgi:hypothetical protein
VQPRLLRAFVALAIGVPVGWLVSQRVLGRAAKGTPLWPEAVVLRVPHAQGSITLDGDTDDPGWRGPTARTQPFVGADGVTAARPDTEARIVWGDGYLYLNLYAADEDIHATATKPDSLAPGDDDFHLVFTDRTAVRTFDVSPIGVVTDGLQRVGSSAPPDLSWDSHAHTSHEVDGTPNRSTDHDEEWVIEMAIPFESLGLRGVPGERIGLSMHRCDTPLDGKRACGSWGEGKRTVLLLE